MIIRQLELSDYRSFLECLNHISPTPTLSFKDFANIYFTAIAHNKTTFVAIEDDKVVGTASVIIEQKYSRGGSFAGFLEDVVVLPEYRNRYIGKQLVKKAIEFAAEKKCFRLILTCDEKLIDYYKEHFYTNGVGMRIDF